MVTIFTIPKAFSGHADVIQRNAIRSWLAIQPRPDVILCGDDPGVAEAARELGTRHVPHLARNAFGTPILSSAFTEMSRIARHPLHCYANADIIFTRDFAEALKHVSFPRYLLVGRRWNLDIREPVAVDAQGW